MNLKIKINIIGLCMMFTTYCIGQEEPEYAQEHPIEQEDIKAALHLMGLDIYNFRVNMPDTSKYFFTVHNPGICWQRNDQ